MPAPPPEQDDWARLREDIRTQAYNAQAHERMRPFLDSLTLAAARDAVTAQTSPTTKDIPA